jgi:hypothetical protein
MLSAFWALDLMTGFSWVPFFLAVCSAFSLHTPPPSGPRLLASQRCYEGLPGWQDLSCRTSLSHVSYLRRWQEIGMVAFANHGGGCSTSCMIPKLFLFCFYTLNFFSDKTSLLLLQSILPTA